MRSHQRLPQNSWPAFARATPPVAPSGRGRRDGSSPKRSVRVARRRVRSADTSALSSLLRLLPAGSTNGGALPVLTWSDTTIRYQLDHPTLRRVHAVPKRKSGLPGASNARRAQAPVVLLALGCVSATLDRHQPAQSSISNRGRASQRVPSPLWPGTFGALQGREPHQIPACVWFRSQRDSALLGSAISSSEAYQYASQPCAGRPANSIRFSGYASLSVQRR